MKLPKKIKSNFWYINRKPILMLWLAIAVIVFALNLLLNLINLI